MTSTDLLLANAARYAAGFDRPPLPRAPALRLAVVACMDSRIDLFALFGLRDGEAHLLRNAGGVVTDDVIRSLAVSQRLFGTEEVVLVHHTDCGLQSVGDDEFRRRIQDETGIRPPWALDAFADVDEDARQSIARVRASPFVPRRERVRGFVYDVDSGRLREVV